MMSNKRVHALHAALLSGVFLAISCASSQADGLPAGQHTDHPKYWSKFSRYVTNFTPLEFGYRIENLTPGLTHDLWFSVGTTIEHIDANDRLISIPMPHWEWRVSGIAISRGQVIFTAGQSGKIGFIDSAENVSYVQVLPRNDFPDLRDFVINDGGEMWFSDAGRRSIAYRSASGRVVENPFPGAYYPTRMRHCMGKLWFVAVDPYRGPSLFMVDENLRPQPYLPVIPRRSNIIDIACDRMDRLWISTEGMVERFNSMGNLKRFNINGGALGADLDGGMWMTPYERYDTRFNLVHFYRNGASKTYVLPAAIPGGNDVAYGPDRTLWLAVDSGNSPIAVTKLALLGR